jgi:hypothetical protein
MKRNLIAVSMVAGILLAQASAPTTTYNGGIPIVPGTRVPESGPIATTPPSYGSAPSAPSAAAPAISAPAGSGASSGPAYSFGAAPPPVVAPGK